MRNRLGVVSFVVAVLSGVITDWAWRTFFPFTDQGIGRLLLFTFVACLVSFICGAVGLRRKPRLWAAIGMVVAVLVFMNLLSKVG